MNNKSTIFLLSAMVLVVGIVGGLIGSVINKTVTGGDFPGGIVPSQLFTGNAGTNSVTPILSNLYLNGGVSVGGVGANNQLPIVYTAVATYPGATSASIATGTTNATTTQIAFSAAGFAVGDPCEIQYNFSTSTLIVSANVSAVSGANVTTTATLLNVGTASVSATVTSTITGASSTIKATCFATGV